MSRCAPDDRPLEPRARPEAEFSVQGFVHPSGSDCKPASPGNILYRESSDSTGVKRGFLTRCAPSSFSVATRSDSPY
eukprot:1180427-Prorocentrum_minimum.AAC.6